MRAVPGSIPDMSISSRIKLHFASNNSNLFSHESTLDVILILLSNIQYASLSQLARAREASWSE